MHYIVAADGSYYSQLVFDIITDTLMKKLDNITVIHISDNNKS
jgi:hypothetical protein